MNTVAPTSYNYGVTAFTLNPHFQADGPVMFRANLTFDSVMLLYKCPFSPSQPLQNLLAINDDCSDEPDAANPRASCVTLPETTTSDCYAIVTTTYLDTVSGGSFSITTSPAAEFCAVPESQAVTAEPPSPFPPPRPPPFPPPRPTCPLSVSGDTSAGKSFYRPNSMTSRDTSGTVKFAAHGIKFNEPVPNGSVTFNLNPTGYSDSVMALYRCPFNPAAPLQNLIAFNDDCIEGQDITSCITLSNLHNATCYVLVAMGYSANEQGAYTITTSPRTEICSLPEAEVVLSAPPSPFPPPRPPPNPPPRPTCPLSVFGDMSSGQFTRPSSTKLVSSGLYNYQAHGIKFNAPIPAGPVTFSINPAGGLDTVMMLYKCPFNPATPLDNLVAYNDDCVPGMSSSCITLPDPSSSECFVLVATAYYRGESASYNISTSPATEICSLPDAEVVIYAPPSPFPPPSPPPNPPPRPTCPLSLAGSTASGDSFLRPDSLTSTIQSDPVKFSAHGIKFNEPVPDGSDTFNLNPTGYSDSVMALYQCPFNPTAPLDNLIAFNDDCISGVRASCITLSNLRAASCYVLVATGYAAKDSGAFSITTSPQTEICSLATDENVIIAAPPSPFPPPLPPPSPPPRPVCPTTMAGDTSSGATFRRPKNFITLAGSSDSVYYFQARAFTFNQPIPTSAITFNLNPSTANRDTFMLLYNGTFDKSSPLTNLVAFNDDCVLGNR